MDQEKDLFKSIIFGKSKVDKINEFLQDKLKKENKREVTAVEAAKWLDRAGLLKDSESRRGKPLRDLLRSGKITGQRQESNSRWYIDRV